jgi:hypothetical protein
MVRLIGAPASGGHRGRRAAAPAIIATMPWQGYMAFSRPA